MNVDLKPDNVKMIFICQDCDVFIKWYLSIVINNKYIIKWADEDGEEDQVRIRMRMKHLTILHETRATRKKIYNCIYLYIFNTYQCLIYV